MPAIQHISVNESRNSAKTEMWVFVKNKLVPLHPEKKSLIYFLRKPLCICLAGFSFIPAKTQQCRVAAKHCSFFFGIGNIYIHFTKETLNIDWSKIT